jgi:hypothetical protein
MVNFWVVIYKSTWILLIVVCLIGLICVFFPQYARYQGLLQDRKDVSREIQFREQRIKRLQLNREKMATDGNFVELVAREAGMVGTNQMLIKPNRR